MYKSAPLIIHYQLYFGRAPASQGRHIPGFASLGASHASPLHAPHAKTHIPMAKTTNHVNPKNHENHGSDNHATQNYKSKKICA